MNTQALQLSGEPEIESGELGLWIFIVSEAFFFAALFVAFLVYFHSYPADFARASAHLSVSLGTINTALLLTSSFTMALAAKFAHERKKLSFFAELTLLLALAFLGVKAVEYQREFSENLFPGLQFRGGESKPFELFFILYFLMTALHALHIIGGVVAISWTTLRARKKTAAASGVELSALYWHFVDLIWVFLYPLLYLTKAGR